MDIEEVGRHIVSSAVKIHRALGSGLNWKKLEVMYFLSHTRFARGTEDTEGSSLFKKDFVTLGSL